MMLGTLYYKGIVGIDSMQEMPEQFNDEAVSKNLPVFMGETKGIRFPSYNREEIFWKAESYGVGRDQAGPGLPDDQETVFWRGKI